jgi:hypothetical protein
LTLFLFTRQSNFTAATPFVAHGRVSPVDFHLFEMLDQALTLARMYEFTDDFTARLPLLTRHHREFSALPANQRYLQSVLNGGLPFNNKMVRINKIMMNMMVMSV